jgi:transposase
LSRHTKPFEVRFETPPGYQAQVDFARFVTTFTDEPELSRIVWLFSLVLGHSRHIFARFVMCAIPTIATSRSSASRPV